MMNAIKRLREKLGLSQAELAALVGSSQPQLHRLENSTRTLTKRWAERLAPHLKTTPQALMFDESQNSGSTQNGAKIDSPNAKITGTISGLGKMIPVYGRAVGGIDGEFEMNGNILYEVMAPPILSSVNGAYAVQVSGDSMAPRYEDGEVCFIDPHRRVRKGDYVIAQIKLEENGALLAYVKKFCRQNSEELILEQFNPPKELRFNSCSVVSVHYIALAGSA